MKRAGLRISAIGIMAVLTAVLSFTVARACTSIFWNNNSQAKLIARTMDFPFSDTPMIYVFPKGMKKKGMSGDSNSATWTSQYGSVVVSSFGDIYMSADGVNTAGLSFHGQWLLATQYPARDLTKPGVLEGRYGEFLMDNAATVSEALTLIQNYQVVPEQLDGQSLPIHLAIEDATGDSAVIEWVGGQMNIYHGSAWNTTVLTNDPELPEQLYILNEYEYFGTGGANPLLGDVSPWGRFARASAFLKTLPEPASPAEAVSYLLSAIRSCTTAPGSGWYYTPPSTNAWTAASPTLWTVVYDLSHGMIYFQHIDPANDFQINMNRLNFRGKKPLYLNATAPGVIGDVTRQFKVYNGPF